MYSSQASRSHRDRKQKRTKSIIDKKLSKLIASGSDTEGESELELSHYIDDRVKLMKEVLKIIKPRKIKSMAPNCMKNMELEEINSMLLEELLGISNKRLKYIFEGKTLDEESSTDEDQPIDVISLDDISDDDFVVISDEESDKRSKKHKRKKIKEEPKRKIKKEKSDGTKEIEKIKDKLSKGGKANLDDKETIGEENLMSVLELLELQARARAIRSQLELETKRKQEEQLQNERRKQELDEGANDDDIIIEVPQEVEIVITSSESEDERKCSHTRVSLQSPIPKTNEESLQNTHVTNENDKATEREDGEVLDSDQIDNLQSNKDQKTIGESDGESSSSDNLQMVKEREKRRIRKKHTEEQPNKVAEEPSPIDKAVEEFMKTQPVAKDNTEELRKLEQEQKQKEEKGKEEKQKRLKNFKYKFQSYKQDVAVESTSSAITVLENIVIKGSNKQVEDSDDLVINVDQDDVDCMISD